MAASRDTLNDLRKAFDRELKKEEEIAVENEQKLLKQVTLYVCSLKGVSPIQGYKPEDIAAFLDQPSSEVQKALGGEWLAMDSAKFENLVYGLYKKVQKSDKLITW
jgi:hypothetical protein